MPQIDFSQAITAEDKAAEATAARATRLKATCRDRILAVVGESAQANIAQAGVIYAAMRADEADAAEARGAVGFAEGDLGTATVWQIWVNAMQSECRRAIAEADDPIWPDVPEGVAELAARF